MNKKVLYNLVLILVLMLAFPLLWVFNQRINYRKVFTLNTRFSISSNQLLSNELSSPTYVLRYLIDKGVSATLSPKVITSSPFTVVGRELLVKDGTIEVFEFGSPNDVSKQLKALEKSPSVSTYINGNTVSYKNLLIYLKTSDYQVRELIEGISNE